MSQEIPTNASSVKVESPTPTLKQQLEQELLKAKQAKRILVERLMQLRSQFQATQEEIQRTTGAEVAIEGILKVLKNEKLNETEKPS